MGAVYAWKTWKGWTDRRFYLGDNKEDFDAETVLREIMCSTDRVTGSVYIVRVSLVLENQVFFIRTSRYNRLLPFTRSSWSTTRD